MNVAFATNDVARSELRDAAKPFATVEGRALAKALQVVNYVTERRNAYPTLSCAKLEIRGTTLIISGTDLEIEVIITVDVEDAGGAWSGCVDARVLGDIARVAGSSNVTISPRGDENLDLRFDDGAAFDLVVLASDAFPSLPGERGLTIERFTNGMLAASLAKVSQFISTDGLRYYINGALWEIGTTGRRFAATDGHRLAVNLYEGKSLGQSSARRIIPLKVVGLLEKHTAGLDVTAYSVARVPDGAAIEFVAPGLVIRAKLIDGTYPDIDRVTPKASDVRFDYALDLPEVTAALRRVSVIFSKFSAHALRFFERDGRLAVEAKNADHGSASVVLSTTWPGAKADFGLKATYLLDVLKHCTGKVTLRQIDASSPFLVMDEDETMTRVIMPMRV
ncbi:DNA polymerase III subunit beta [Paradevosia shaoguanensis]|uniref:DNA polymerase III subunit beta n=1 Tax=Paradevosia shaoguanensis TaxID=1335043 RepID=UPI0019349B72|nr:DNA polymerase III subunit beta [Paradevosia shaoguanensis]